MDDEPRRTAVVALKKSLHQIAVWDVDELAERKDLGAISFESGKALFQQSIDLAKEAAPLPWELLPVVTVNEVQQSTDAIAAGFNQISEFTLVGQANPEQQRDNLLTQAQTQYDQFLTAMKPNLPYLTLKSAQIQDLIVESADLLNTTKQTVSKTLEEIEQKRTTIDSIVRAAQDAAAKIGVAQFATKFEEIANAHDKSSRAWLGGTVFLGLATIGLAAYFLSEAFAPTESSKDPATIHQIVTKLVVISLLYIAAVWSSRNYRSHRHLAVVNRHRQNALATFETFVKAVGEEDQQTKNAVLLEATRCIFSPTVTGYISADTDTSGNRIIEILKTVGAPGE